MEKEAIKELFKDIKKFYIYPCRIYGDGSATYGIFIDEWTTQSNNEIAKRQVNGKYFSDKPLFLGFFREDERLSEKENEGSYTFEDIKKLINNVLDDVEVIEGKIPENVKFYDGDRCIWITSSF